MVVVWGNEEIVNTHSQPVRGNGARVATGDHLVTNATTESGLRPLDNGSDRYFAAQSGPRAESIVTHFDIRRSSYQGKIIRHGDRMTFTYVHDETYKVQSKNDRKPEETHSVLGYSTLR